MTAEGLAKKHTMTTKETTTFPSIPMGMEGDDAVSVCSSSTNTDGSMGPNNRRPSKVAPTMTLAKKETKLVARSKMLVCFVLLVATAIVATMTYRYTNYEQEKDFEIRFQDFANQIISVYQINARNIVIAYEMFALHISTYAIGTNAEWPFVTVPKFIKSASSAMAQTGSRSIAVTPIVTQEQSEAWTNYTVRNRDWVQESYDRLNLTMTDENGNTVPARAPPIIPYIWGDFRNPQRPPLEEPLEEYYTPMWQSILIDEINPFVNFDTQHFPNFNIIYKEMDRTQQPILSYARMQDANQLPESFMVVPIFDRVDDDDDDGETPTPPTIVAALTSLLPWHNYFVDLVPEGIDGIYLVIQNTCGGDSFTYEINGPIVEYVGIGDLHDIDYDAYEIRTPFTTFTGETRCINTLHIYPSDTFRQAYTSNKPIRYTCYAVVIIVMIAFVFIVYDCLVEQRQDKVMTTATRSTAIVSSLFPENVRDRLMDETTNANATTTNTPGNPNHKSGSGGENSNSLTSRLEQFNKSSAWKTDHVLQQQDSLTAVADPSTKPIADLFPNATVMFADISGFTAWSSVREPSQVFTLLESIYNSFDRIARRRKVFKVETIGDCYVAATGLPEKMEDHALVMARFARDCLKKMTDVTKKLETTLGPDTAELGIRVGIHSGPVTAGVLRGEKSRFQLFGDTVNTAARMESTGMRNRVHISQETASMIPTTVKDMWIKPRENLIEPKGKGKMQTYWLDFKTVGTASTSSSILGSTLLRTKGDEEEEAKMHYSPEDIATAKSQKVDRLIGWNVDVLQGLLKKIIAMRGNKNQLDWKNFHQLQIDEVGPNATVLDEMKEIITLPSQASQYTIDPASITIAPEVTGQLLEYVTSIAQMYRSNSFHSFEHASHVTQSVTKLLSRVVTPDTYDLQHGQNSGSTVLHEYTFGITSDPITQFAVAFSALIHDVDHQGVPNSQLVKERNDQASLYKNKSVAEQNSVDLAWGLLMEPKYRNLRACIYTTKEELNRFRQVLVNAVMATDIVDKELGQLRKKRWETAFKNADEPNDTNTTTKRPSSLSSLQDANRKATIVIEHLIQASDVAHTMQHWHVYLKWNERFFHECYQAYVDGRAEKDPSDGWYQGELGFFDFYIIPLAKKLKECNVFGVASDEYLNYAQANRAEWEMKGKDLVQGYLRTYQEIQSRPSSTKDLFGKL